MNKSNHIPLSSAVVGLLLFISELALATGTGTGGRDVFHVPMSWCAVQGSPAASAPNITPIGSATADTNTDAVLWRRHERPTDNILLPQADITLRSAINDAWGTLNFPIIADPNTIAGLPGDVRGEDSAALAAGSEFANLIQNCDAAWSALGRAGIGITAININLFHDVAGDYIINAPGGGLQGYPVGWAGCTKSTTTNVCVNSSTTPYDGRVVVADNQYFYPTVLNRTLPTSPNGLSTGIQYNADPLDVLTGHETGHSLGLPHRNGATNLMNPGLTDNSGDGQIDNIGLNAAEISILRQSSVNVPGVQIDPPMQVDPGDFTAMALTDDDSTDENQPAYTDIASVKTFFNKKTGMLFVDVVMKGVMPKQQGTAALVTLGIDARNSDALARETIDGVAGIDLLNEVETLISMRVSNDRVDGTAITVKDGKLINLGEIIRFDLRRLTMYPLYMPITGQKEFVLGNGKGADIYDVVSFRIPAIQLGIGLNKLFRLQVVSSFDGKSFDVARRNNVNFLEFKLEEAFLPKCFAQAPAAPGGIGKVLVEGLTPNAGIHGLLGPDEVFKGTTDGEGNAEVDLAIPNDARGGLHLVTVGVDDTAFTADCVIDVQHDTATPPSLPDNNFLKICCEKMSQYLLLITIALSIIILLMLYHLFRRR